MQCYYNLLNDSNARPLPHGSSLHDHGQLLSLAAELGFGVIGIRNLAAGSLSDALDRPVEDDSLVDLDYRRAESLRFLEEDGTPLSRWAARYALEQATISTVVPGVKNAAELSDQIAAVDLPALSNEQLARIDSLRETDFGVRQPIDVVL